MCIYSYKVNQQFAKDASQNLTFSASVETTCHSGVTLATKYYAANCESIFFHIIIHAVGLFNHSLATQYCMTVTDAKVDGVVFNETSDETERY